MKLVIQTQHRENYGAHDWDGKGSCPQYWKMKGGNTYVVEDLSTRSINKISDNGIPTLSCLIESKSDMFEEYIIDWEIVGDDAVVCDDWDSPYVLTFDSESLLWCATRVTLNGDMGYMRSEIQSQTESFTMGRDGERNSHTNSYVMEDGKVLQYSELQQWFDNQKEVA
jgi:hypothetical protein